MPLTRATLASWDEPSEENIFGPWFPIPFCLTFLTLFMLILKGYLYYHLDIIVNSQHSSG